MNVETYKKADQLFKKLDTLSKQLKFLPKESELYYYGAYSKLVRYDDFGNRELGELKIDIDKKEFVNTLRKDIVEKIAVLEEEIKSL